jgi:hypothetical protein
MASDLTEALGKKVTFINVEPQDMLQFLLNARFPQWQAEGLVEDYAHYACGEASVVTNDIYEVTGKTPRNFKEFTRDYAGYFK